jgi:hypothetical protein
MTLASSAHGVYVLRQEQERHRRRLTMRFQTIALAVAFVFACILVPAAGVFPRAWVCGHAAVRAKSETVQPVSGSGVHFLTTAIVHSSTPTATGLIQRSTETVDLTGDLTGRILYHPTSVIDFLTQTLVNTGHQVFSGTVLGSEPVMLHDDTFRFDVDLRTKTGIGTVHLADRIDGPNVRCDLIVVSTGMTADGNVAADYTGECRLKNK